MHRHARTLRTGAIALLSTTAACGLIAEDPSVLLEGGTRASFDARSVGDGGSSAIPDSTYLDASHRPAFDGGPLDASHRLAFDSAPVDASHRSASDGALADARNNVTSDSGLSSPDATAACPGGPWVLFSVTDNTLKSPLSSSIYARHPDGSGGHVVAFPHPNVAFARVSPDGASVVYQSPLDGSLYVYRFGAASDVELVSDVALASGNALGASISPDGTRVVFTSGDDLAVVPADGTGAPENVPGGSLLAAPYYDGPIPLFTGDTRSIVSATAQGIESLRIDNGDVDVLIDIGSRGADLAFSPDYESLATISFCSPSPYELAALRTYPPGSLPASCASGHIVTIFTEQNYYGLHPAWGPTGIIAYALSPDVFLVSATGGTPTNLTSDLTAQGVSVDAPTWAPACTPL